VTDLLLACRTVRLTQPVLELFDREIDFTLGKHGNAGMMYGRLSAPDELTVAYVLPLAANLADGLNRGPGYVIGRCQAATTLAWHLLALQPIGYWFSFPGAPNLERVQDELHDYRQLDIVNQNCAQLIVFRDATGAVAYSAYAVPRTATPPAKWRELICLQDG